MSKATLPGTVFQRTLTLVAPSGVLALALFALLQTSSATELLQGWSFLLQPSETTAPLFWSLGLGFCSLGVLLYSRRHDFFAFDKNLVGKKIALVGLTGVYITLLDQEFLGYYTDTSIFLCLLLLGAQRQSKSSARSVGIVKPIVLITGITSCWLLFVYLVFEKTLSITPPESTTPSLNLVKFLLATVW